MSIAIDAELAHRFKAALERLNPEGGRIGLAVSGGPDSMAMLLLAHGAIPGAFEVATVDHGLRPEAREECALVEAACAERGVPCEVLTVEVDEGNVQAKAREARYGALGDWARDRGLACVATAHHADDQAETVLMRLNRGSGLQGVLGIRPVISIGGCKVIRPVLDLLRQELGAVCQTGSVEFAKDPSNEDLTYDRVRVRKLLRETDWIDPAAIAKSAAVLFEAFELIASEAQSAYDFGATKQSDGYDYAPSQRRLIDIELLHEMLRKLGCDVRRSEVSRAVDRLSKGQNASLAGILISHAKEETGYYEGQDIWRLRPEPPRRTC